VLRDVNAPAVRVVGPADVPAAAATLTGAFRTDPLWSWVFDDPERRAAQMGALWTLCLEGSIDHRWVWTVDGEQAVALWIPPGEPELTEPHASRLRPLLDEVAPDRAALALAVFDAFDAAHPTDRPHHYLSLLGTHPDHRGRGLGMALLADNLARIDAGHGHAYLESSNPANLDRYRSVGFEVVSEYAVVDGGPVIHGMWRDAR
jgi:GNAT superfamily N-acetyltransferase